MYLDIMTSTLRAPLLRLSAVGFVLVASPACTGEVDKPLPVDRQAAEVQSLGAAAEPVHLDVGADRALAEQGDADAQARLAEAYYLGLGVAQDFQEALRWSRLAVDQGSARGQGVLASAYNTGSGVEQNYEEALRWSRLAAEQGDPRGQVVLGTAYGNGRGVAQDHEEAVRLYRLGAEQGNYTAQHLLGMMYFAGRGVERDFVAAYMWLSLATAAGSGISDGGAHETLAKFMTPEQLAEAEARARDWSPTRSEAP